MDSLSLVLTNGQEIHSAILKELNSASQSIRVAVAWFTNRELLDALINAQKRGCSTSVIIADNDDNNKLSFQDLTKEGGKVIRIKGKGFGMMHQKYCIIDERIAINGSFNWTNNAISNNSENAIITREPEIINTLKANFEEMQISQDSPREIEKKIAGTRFIKVQSEDEEAFVDDLNKLTATLISQFDQSKVEAMGYSKALEQNGDGALFPSLLTGILHELREEVYNDEERKKNYKRQVELLWESRKSQITDKKKRQLDSIDTLMKSEFNAIDQQEVEAKNKITSQKDEIIRLKENELKDQLKLDDLEEDVHKLKESTPIIPFTWKRWLPIAIFMTLAFLYLAIFYSSAIYTLQYVETEAETALMQGSQIPHVEFFNPKAIVKVWDKGIGAVLFTFIAVFIPIGLACVKLYSQNKFWRIFLGLILAVLVVDAFVAFAIDQTIFKVDVLSGDAQGEYVWLNAFSSLEFYKVFIFGALPLLMFKLLVEKFHSMWLEGSIEHVNKKVAHQLRLAKEKLIELKTNLEMSTHKREQAEEGLSELKESLDNLKEIRTEIERNFEQQKNEIVDEYDDKLNRNHRMLEIFQSSIDGARTHLVDEAFNARVSSLKTGWHKFLSEFFSSNQVKIRSEELDRMQEEWMTKNFNPQ
ncbi:phospholipase D-like domain-containing protein [Phaeocystidibacter luteus]|uniref:phospholipase D n=1 Tax=Phaeocystidibacter luteus TaxID=911197 RepID=A0A6N6RFZ6_9FLAO|nr:phospholipase D-like domain-containing protein [Phaeocystidibacter luteus]KAB2809999.1 hypothetical protein F8C67_08960 [Phaeocystidibacter luteus]